VENIKILSFVDNEIKSCFFKNLNYTFTYNGEIVKLEDREFIRKYVVIDAFNPREDRKEYSLEEVFADFLNLDVDSNDSVKSFVNKYGILNNFCIIKESKYRSFLLARRNSFSNLYIINADKTKAWKIYSHNLSKFGIRGKPRYIGDFFYRNISSLIGKNLYIGELIDVEPKPRYSKNKHFYISSKISLPDSIEFSWKDLHSYAKKLYGKLKNKSVKSVDILHEFPLNLFLIHFGGYLVYKNLNLINFNASLGNKFVDAVLEVFGKEYIGTKIKICLNPKCKKFFISKSSKAEFCSDKCRYAFNKMKKDN